MRKKIACKIQEIQNDMDLIFKRYKIAKVGDIMQSRELPVQYLDRVGQIQEIRKFLANGNSDENLSRWANREYSSLHAIVADECHKSLMNLRKATGELKRDLASLRQRFAEILDISPTRVAKFPISVCRHSCTLLQCFTCKGVYFFAPFVCVMCV